MTSPKVSDTQFAGEISVASRIIDSLSSGLYNSPAACLKELVNNSYDADATQVSVFVRPDADRIIIEDNGIGMSKDDFTSHFSRISESHKRDISDQTESGRPKIGKIGIGFIAANEICDLMEIYSTKEGSSELLHVKIDFASMRDPLPSRRRQTGIKKADYVGTVQLTEKQAHYTKVFLKGVRGNAKMVLAGAVSIPRADIVVDDIDEPAHTRSLYGMATKSILEELKSRPPSTWLDFDAYTQTMLRVALNVPVCYYSGWMPQPLDREVKDFEKATARLHFNVNYDGSELRKPIVFDPEKGSALVSRFTYSGKHVAATGYFYVQHGVIKPRDLHGLLIRIRSAAVGEYDQSFLGFPPSHASLIQRWVSAEVWADDRLEDAMNIDRRTLRETHPAYTELRDAIHAHLEGVLRDARVQLYEKENSRRRRDKAIKSSVSLQAVATNRIALVAPALAANLKQTWHAAARKPAQQKNLLRTFSIAEIYEIVLDVGLDFLPPATMRKFLRALSERLEK